MITLRFEGLDEIQKAMDPENFIRQMDIAILECAEVMENTVKADMPTVSKRTTGYGAKGTPADTGALRDRTEKKKLGLLAAGVISHVNYSGYVHDGTRKMPARPYFQWAFEDFGAKQKMEKVLVEHMGQAIGVSMVS